MMTTSRKKTKLLVALRRVQSNDYIEIHNLFSQPGVNKGTLQIPFPSLDAWKKRLSEPSEDYFSIVSCVKESVVGFLGIKMSKSFSPRSHVGEISMAIHDKWQGMGIGKRLLEEGLNLADNWLNLTRLELRVFVDNKPAIWLYRLHEFKIEGILRCYAFHNGEYKDMYCMARLNKHLGCKDYKDAIAVNLAE